MERGPAIVLIGFMGSGKSSVGRELAARSADLVFTAQTVIPDGQAFRNDLRDRVIRCGRAPADVKILPRLLPIAGRTDPEPREK